MDPSNLLVLRSTRGVHLFFLLQLLIISTLLAQSPRLSESNRLRYFIIFVNAITSSAFIIDIMYSYLLFLGKENSVSKYVLVSDIPLALLFIAACLSAPIASIGIELCTIPIAKCLEHPWNATTLEGGVQNHFEFPRSEIIACLTAKVP